MGGMKLTFKGDKPEKKRKKKSSEHDGESSSKRHKAGDGSDVEDYGGDEQTWVPVERVTDLNGPTFLFQQHQPSDGSTAQPYVLSLNSTLHRVEAQALKGSTRDETLASAALLDLDGAELSEAIVDPSPSSVAQVWVASRMLDTPSDAPIYTFRSSESKFLGATLQGALSCDAEARGPLQMWTVLPPKDGQRGVRIKGPQDQYLGVDEVAGGKMVVRADLEEGTETVWEARVQWKFRHEARKREVASLPLTARERAGRRVEADQALDQEKLIKSRQGWGPGRSQTYTSGSSSEDRKAIRKSQKEGRMAEELLDRRSKTKSDRYAK